MLRATFLLLSFAFVLAWCALRFGGVLNDDLNYVLLGLGVMLLAGYFPFGSPALAAPPDWPLYFCALALPAWALLQLVPLPLALLDLISPARAALSRGVLPFDSSIVRAPLSIRPEATRQDFLRFLSYAATFLIARDLMWRFPRGQWRVAAPLLVVGILEACLGLVQDAVNANNVFPSGTFVNRDHFSSLLEIALPFAFGGMVEYWSRTWRRPFLACTLAAGGAIMLAAVAASLSRAGFLISLGSLTALGTVQVNRRFRGIRRMAGLTGGAVALLGAIVMLATPNLLGRFVGQGGVTGIIQENRWQFWHETLQLIALFPLTGCGFGAFVSGIARFRHAAPTRTLDYAHNSGLQLAAEGGVIALVVALAGLALIVRRLNQAWPKGSRRAELPLACALSLFAALAHSMLDFNLSIPACALAFAWVAGMTAGLRFSPSIPTHRPLATNEVLNQFRR